MACAFEVNRPCTGKTKHVARHVPLTMPAATHKKTLANLLIMLFTSSSPGLCECLQGTMTHMAPGKDGWCETRGWGGVSKLGGGPLDLLHRYHAIIFAPQRQPTCACALLRFPPTVAWPQRPSCMATSAGRQTPSHSASCFGSCTQASMPTRASLVRCWGTTSASRACGQSSLLTLLLSGSSWRAVAGRVILLSGAHALGTIRMLCVSRSIACMPAQLQESHLTTVHQPMGPSRYLVTARYTMRCWTDRQALCCVLCCDAQAHV
jgi:hypothetical protein